MAEKAILYDAARCTACRGCQAACKQWNESDEGEGEKTTNFGSYENPRDLSPKTWLKMEFREVERNGKVSWLFSRRACMHCTDAGCVKVCPTKAVFHHELGFVAYNKDLCSGCGYCIEACPFNVPRLTGNRISGIGKMDKCTFCTTPNLDRVDNGQEPACVKTCPPHALAYGDRDKLVAEGRKRVATLQANGNSNAYLFGDKELDGLHVLYVLAEAPATYGLPINPKVPAASVVWQNVMQPLGWVLGGLTIVGLGLNFMVAREARLTKGLPGKKEE
ncbi:MAG: 4Fe-4S dicluster domain-containing protein [Chloroflexi bacterium]|nr:4Fe-4S dicluster domain-containing protein [Chloroflexota bacterium]